jgi:hypothetical protein
MIEGTTHTNALVSLDYVVNSVFNKLGRYTQRHYDQYLQFAIEGFGELNMFHISNIRVAHLQMNDAKIVSLPPDFIDYTKVAVCINGRLWTLSLNENMCLPRAEVCGEPIREVVHGVPGETFIIPGDGYYFADHYYNGRFIAGLYGLGGGFNIAYFRLDTERRNIVFSGSIPNDEVVLEYISTGIDKNNQTLIPRQAVKALQNYILWQRIENDDKYTLAEKQRKETLFDQAVYQLTSFDQKITKEEYLDMTYKHNKQSTKR